MPVPPYWISTVVVKVLLMPPIVFPSVNVNKTMRSSLNVLFIVRKRNVRISCCTNAGVAVELKVTTKFVIPLPPFVFKRPITVPLRLTSPLDSKINTVPLSSMVLLASAPVVTATVRTPPAKFELSMSDTVAEAASNVPVGALDK